MQTKQKETKTAYRQWGTGIAVLLLLYFASLLGATFFVLQEWISESMIPSFTWIAWGSCAFLVCLWGRWRRHWKIGDCFLTILLGLGTIALLGYFIFDASGIRSQGVPFLVASLVAVGVSSVFRKNGKKSRKKRK